MAIYVKTRKGMDELLARRSSIDSRLNSVLLLVDGKRSDQEILGILKSSGVPADTLEILFHGGYIGLRDVATVTPFGRKPAEGKTVPTGAPMARPAGPANTAASGTTSGTSAASTTAPHGPKTPEKTEFQALYEFMVKKTKETLGLRGITMQLRIERADSVEALIDLVEVLTEAIAKRGGLQDAHQFSREVMQVMAPYKKERPGLRLIVDSRFSSVPTAPAAAQTERGVVTGLHPKAANG